MTIRDKSVVVIGAGPAGLRAVEALSKAGLRPILIDEAPLPGGQIYRQPPVGARRDPKTLYGFEATKASDLHGLIDRLGDRVDYRPGTLVWGIEGHRLDLLSNGQFSQISFDALILSTGAMDRVIPFPGWTLPGAFTLGAAQIALKSQGVAIGRRVALVGAGPLLPLVAYQYWKAGATLSAVLDVTPFLPKAYNLRGLMRKPGTFAKGLCYTLRLALAGHPIQSGVRAIRAEGADRVEALVWIDVSGKERRVEVDAIGASFGLKSEAQLADLAGCRFGFDQKSRQWQPERTPEGRSTVPGIYLAGDGSGIGGADVAELTGEMAALSLIEDLGQPVEEARIQDLAKQLDSYAPFRSALEAAYPFPHHLIEQIDDSVMICRCEGMTAGQLRQAVNQRGATEMNRLKALTRIGMGRCQGRVCGPAAAEVLAREAKSTIEAVGRLRGNPPVKPIPVREVF